MRLRTLIVDIGLICDALDFLATDCWEAFADCYDQRISFTDGCQLPQKKGAPVKELAEGLPRLPAIFCQNPGKLS